MIVGQFYRKNTCLDQTLENRLREREFIFSKEKRENMAPIKRSATVNPMVDTGLISIIDDLEPYSGKADF